MARAKKTYSFKELAREHQLEVIGHLGKKAARTTVWRLEKEYPTYAAAAFAWDTAIMVHDSRVDAVASGLKAGGDLRPILIDDLVEGDGWIEGIHRSIASGQLGRKTMPVLLRVK